jgi:hypothetical protein
MLARIWTHSNRCIPAWLGLAATLGCSDEVITEPERATITLEITPTSLTITRGESATLEVSATRTGDLASSLVLSVIGAPAGVTSTVSNSQTIGLVTTAIITIEANGATTPGIYGLQVYGTGDRVVPATAALSLTVVAVPLPCPPTGECQQWAVGATASSEYSGNEWSAFQAAGPPNVIGCSDDIHAWASYEPHGIEGLELAYANTVLPTGIEIYENWGVSSIVKVEVGDGSGTYHTVYTAEAERLSCPRVLAIPVTGIATAMKLVRVTVDQRTLRDWNEIDAVKLIGTR